MAYGGCFLAILMICSRPAHVYSGRVSGTDEDGPWNFQLNDVRGEWVAGPLRTYIPGGDNRMFAYYLARGRGSRGTYNEAIQYCNSMNTSLVTVRNQEERNFLIAMQRNNRHGFWLGLARAPTEDFNTWSDGYPVVYESWAPSEPSSLGTSSELCVFQGINAGNPSSWNDGDCSLRKRIMCRKLIEPTHFEPTEEEVQADRCVRFTCGADCGTLAASLGCGWSSRYQRCVTGGHTRSDEMADGFNGDPTACDPTTTTTTSTTPEAPTMSPTEPPSNAPTGVPTTAPTTVAPTSTSPTSTPTDSPTSGPTSEPSASPITAAPTSQPTHVPTDSPTSAPTAEPTGTPSTRPSMTPTMAPSTTTTTTPEAPTESPTDVPTVQPTNVPTQPTSVPTSTPSHPPTYSPTNTPSNAPTDSPTDAPSSTTTTTPEPPSICEMPGWRTWQFSTGQFLSGYQEDYSCCYKHFSAPRLSWDQAEAQCQLLGDSFPVRYGEGHLARPTSFAHLSWLWNVLRPYRSENDKSWIGGRTYQGNATNISWTDTRQEYTGIPGASFPLGPSSGSTWPEMPWADGEPSGTWTNRPWAQREECIQMGAGRRGGGSNPSQLWNDAVCSYGRSYICQFCAIPPIRRTWSPTTPPTQAPTDAPSTRPTATPTAVPTDLPTYVPTTSPTVSPTTTSPTMAPSTTTTTTPEAPTDSPTSAPTTSAPVTDSPTALPSYAPSSAPSNAPTTTSPTRPPTATPSTAPSHVPSASPTQPPSNTPTTSEPTSTPTNMPTMSPTIAPTNAPTQIPTSWPTRSCRESDVVRTLQTFSPWKATTYSDHCYADPSSTDFICGCLAQLTPREVNTTFANRCFFQNYGTFNSWQSAASQLSSVVAAASCSSITNNPPFRCQDIVCSNQCGGSVTPQCGWSSRHRMCKAGAYTRNDELNRGRGGDNSLCPEMTTTGTPVLGCASVRCARECNGQCGWSRRYQDCRLGARTNNYERRRNFCNPRL